MARSTHHRHGHRHGRPGPGHDPARLSRERRRAARYDHRRERRLRRRASRPVVAVAVVAGAVLLTGSAVAVLAVLTALAQILAVVVLVALVTGTVQWLRTGLRPVVPPATAVPPGVVDAEQAWRAARAEFQRVRAEFAAHETDPMAVLHRPALSDVGVASTARFVDAFAAAQALDTDGYPGEPYDASYVRAVGHARNAWRAAVDAADRIRLTGLDPAERRTVERIAKLLTTARDSDSEPERLAAYARARSELDRLDRAGVVHLPRPARATLDARARGELGTRADEERPDA